MGIFKQLIPSLAFTDEESTALHEQFIRIYNDELKRVDLTGTLSELLTASNTSIENLTSALPPILLKHKLYARKYSNFCRSCIITDSEVFEMAENVHAFWRDSQRPNRKATQDESEDEPLDLLLMKPFEDLENSQQKLFFEFIYLIPIVFKTLGYELYRPSEDIYVNKSMAETLARAIHSRFRKHMTDNSSADAYQGMYLVDSNRETYSKAFDDLSQDMKDANIDNAYHIPTKLLSVGYKIEACSNKSSLQMLQLNDNELEMMAFIEHCRWSWERRLNGWLYSEKRDNSLKHHNCLLPYEELPAHEQEKDRIMVRFIPSLLHDLEFNAIKISPELANDIPYINQHVGFIFNVETKIRNIQSLIHSQKETLFLQYKNIIQSSATLEELKKELNGLYRENVEQHLLEISDILNRTEEEIKFIKSTYKSGRNVQKTFMPQSVELKSYFPDSFILFKPKDIVSGDFYFTSKVENSVIFIAADCTGHGISGSILSGICYNYLHLAINERKIAEPLHILQDVMPKLRHFLKHSHFPISGNNEMELSICKIELSTLKLSVGCYGRPVYCIKNNEIIQLGKGATDAHCVNGFYVQEIELQTGDSIYAFSDGYTDQLGGEKGKKYMSRRFKRKLRNIQTMDMQQQCYELNNEIDNWRLRRGEYHFESNGQSEDQTDDITLIGIRI